MMQTVCINIDRVNLLKEESGQYYIGTFRSRGLLPCCLSFATGFGSKMNEVLQAVEATIRIVNSFNEPLAWEIAKYVIRLAFMHRC